MEFVARMMLGAGLLAGLCAGVACAGTSPSPVPSPTTTPETDIHIFSLSPRAGSTLDYNAAVRISGHYTFSARDSARRGTAAMWLCLGVDRQTFIAESCSGGHHSSTDEFSETATMASSAAQPRSGGFDTQFAHLLLVDGPLFDGGMPASSNSRVSEVTGAVLAGLTFPHAIHWQ
jgi:hypothetical protein